MAGNIRIGAGVETPAQSRTSVSGGFSLPAQPAPAPQVPAGYQLMYQMGGPRYMYGETPRYGAYYSDGGTVPGQIYGNMRGSREGADMFGFFPTMFQSQPYATASQMYTPSLGVMPLIGYPSKYPHVIMGGYSDYGAPIANQAMNMMLPLLMMGLYRQMFPMPGAAPAAAAGGGGKKGGGGSGGGGGDSGAGQPSATLDENAINLNPYAAYLTRNLVDAHPELAAAAKKAQADQAATQAAAQSATSGIAKSASQVKEATKPWYRQAIDFFKSSSYTPQAKDAPVQVNQPTKTAFGLYDYY